MQTALVKTYQKIKDLQVQGATAVAKTILTSVAMAGAAFSSNNLRLWQKELRDAAAYLLSARPTEPMAQNLVHFLLDVTLAAGSVVEGKRVLKQIARELNNFVDLGSERLVEFGEKLLKNDERIFTHCHSSSVEKILVGAKNQGKKLTVFNTETRPLYQGHITAKNLLKQGIKTTLVTDSSAAFLLSPHSGKDPWFTKVLIGADVIFSHGGVVNKIGSFSLALAAHDAGVPVYIVAHLLKVDDDGKIEIEKRSAREVWPRAPKGLAIVNLAFDAIPAKYITGFITEFGILKPSQIKKVVRKKYPWLLK